jgi:hypothetical protein
MRSFARCRAAAHADRGGGAAGARLLRWWPAMRPSWDLNVPPVARLVREATSHLEAACQAVGRDPTAIGRSMWLFARPGRPAGDASLASEFRRWHPWFRSLPEADLGEAILAGPAPACRARIAAIRGDLGIDLPILDLAGLPQPEAERALADLAAA